jgi:hypothetical protein
MNEEWEGVNSQIVNDESEIGVPDADCGVPISSLTYSAAFYRLSLSRDSLAD